MNRPVVISMVFAGLGLALGARGDTLYLKDGSVLIGTVGAGPGDRVLLTSPVFGEVSIPGSNVVYRLEHDPNALSESYRIMGAGLGIMGHLVREVPDQVQGRPRFSLLVPGDVWGVTDTAGRPLLFSHRLLDQTSHLTVDYNDLATDTTHLVITTWQTERLEPTAAGDLALRLQYIPDQEQDVRLVVTYPAGMALKEVPTEATAVLPGLVVWHRHLARQQQFSPAVVLGPR